MSDKPNLHKESITILGLVEQFFNACKTAGLPRWASRAKLLGIGCALMK